VRPAQSAELPALPEVERAAARLFPPGRIPDPEQVHGVEELTSYLEDGLLWVTADAEQVMGYVIARKVDDTTLHVYELAVDPRFGRQGMGTALMLRAVAEAERRRLHRVTLTTFEDLPWNAPFYRRLGFRVLEGPSLTDPLRRLLDGEHASGMTRRVAMCLDLES